VSLIHDNGDTKEAMARLAMPNGTLIIKYGDLSGEYVFDIRRNTLHALGKGGGQKRTPIPGWRAKSIKEAKALWTQMSNTTAHKKA
jgi:hypothetical protein